ncbi:uncharacterized protein [Salvelinus alpinus]|uniref:uncharacterized protein isoform X2 n=1 Tax=Salvelinus alpinus TaxID=8036 RepID=UPI0039FC21CB
MANCMVFHNQIASIMEMLANSAVAEICKLVDDDYAVFRLEMTQSQKDNRGLRRKLQLLELKVARERAERTLRQHVVASRPSSVKILDRYRGMARGEGHLTGGHRSFVKPAGHNVWRDDQPIAIDEGSGTSTQHVIVIESANADAAGAGVKQERNEGEDPRHNRDIQTGAAAGVAPPLVTEDLANAAAPQARTRRSITEIQRAVKACLQMKNSGSQSWSWRLKEGHIFVFSLAADQLIIKLQWAQTPVNGDSTWFCSLRPSTNVSSKLPCRRNISPCKEARD